MESGLNTGLELLVLGVSMVFLVLMFLMFVMMVMSKIVNIRTKAQAKPVGDEVLEEELAVIMAVLNEVNPGHEVSNVQLKLVQ